MFEFSAIDAIIFRNGGRDIENKLQKLGFTRKYRVLKNHFWPFLDLISELSEFSIHVSILKQSMPNFLKMKNEMLKKARKTWDWSSVLRTLSK